MHTQLEEHWKRLRRMNNLVHLLYTYVVNSKRSVTELRTNRYLLFSVSTLSRNNKHYVHSHGHCGELWSPCLLLKSVGGW